jgi:hypothetical protein
MKTVKLNTIIKVNFFIIVKLVFGISFHFITAPSFSEVAGKRDSGFMEGGLVVSGNLRSTGCAVLARYTAPGPPHVDAVVSRTFGANAVHKTFVVLNPVPIIT